MKYLASIITSESEEDNTEEEPWRAEATTHTSIQFVNKFNIPLDMTPYEVLRYKLIPSIPIYIYRVSGQLVYTQEPVPEGEITADELLKWTETLIVPQDVGGPLEHMILRASFDINRLRTRTKTIPK